MVKEQELNPQVNMNKFFTYIMTNHTNTTLYTGHTSQQELRVWKHKKGFYPNAFTKRYRIYKVVWLQAFSTRKEAMEAEKKIKDWKRDKKIHLIKEKNPKFLDLVRNSLR